MTDLIIVDITENEKTLFDGSLNLKEITGHGKLTIKNPSKKSRLWNLKCDLKENVNTTIADREIKVGILNAAQEFSSEYTIQNLKEPSLKIEEVFDAEIDITDKINTTFLYNNDNKCKLKLILTNPLELTFSNIKLRRDIPDFFQEIEVINPNYGIAGIVEEGGRRSLNWDIVTLEGQNKAELEVFCIVNVKEREAKPLGHLKITYLINNYKLTMINPEVQGLTDSMSGIDRDEGSKPGFWDCNVEFINESEFQVRIEDVKVSHKILTGSEIVVSQNPNRLLNPEQTWDFKFQVESKDVPELSSKIDFTPLYVVITRVIGEIQKEPTVYKVMSATIEKNIAPSEVDAYANTDISISNTIINNGSSPIETVKILDEIPPDFEPPLLSQIKIILGNIDIGSRTEFTKGLVLNPDDQDPASKHNLSIELFNLSNEFQPNSKLIFSYPLKARNPRPPTEALYKTPVKIEVNSLVQGKYYLTVPKEEPELKVKYVKRKLKTLKSIKPGLSEGEFSISVRIQNNGNVELENILIKEMIPKGFDLSEISLEKYELVKIGEESELRVKIPELKGNESFSLNYNCSGQGEYPRFEPEVIVKGREDIDLSTKSSSSPVKSEISAINQERSAIINELFGHIFKRIDQTITGNDLGNYIESLRDEFPPGPALHQFMQFAKEIKIASSEKLIVGTLRDEIIMKLKEFKNIYI